MHLQTYFKAFRDKILGDDLVINQQRIIYADWMASGRLYRPIESYMCNHIAPIVANTYSKATYTGQAINHHYQKAQTILKQQVNAKPSDHLITGGAGMTELFYHFQRVLLEPYQKLAKTHQSQGAKSLSEQDDEHKPVVFITHMEHFANHQSWLAYDVTLEIIAADAQGLPDTKVLQRQLVRYKNRPLKIGSFTAASNISGIKVDYHLLAEIMHQHNGLCFVDFAASAPYVEIDMNPSNRLQQLDMICFSPHKFLAGPGSCGVLVIKNKLLSKQQLKQFEAGTPAFLQTIRAALAMQLKQTMGVESIQAREAELVELLYAQLEQINELNLIDGDQRDRLAVASFYVDEIPAELMVRMLSERFAIESRAGNSFHLNDETADEYYGMPEIAEKKARLQQAQLGWLRISLHPTTTNEEVFKIIDAIKTIIKNFEQWQHDYFFCEQQRCYLSLNRSIAEQSVYKMSISDNTNAPCYFNIPD